MAKDVALKEKVDTEEANLLLITKKAELNKAKAKAEADLARTMAVY